MLKLSCPSCGGNLNLPEHLEIAHCIYCGTKIILQDSERPKDALDLSRFTELAQTALQAHNYEDALNYSNKVLEIDPRNVNAWINKATSTFWLTTAASNRYDESQIYLDRAVQIAPNDPKIAEARENLKKMQIGWLAHLGSSAIDDATEIIKIWADDTPVKKQEKCTDKILEAVRYFLLALEYDPYNLQILENLSGIVKTGNWIKWNQDVLDRVGIYERLKLKEEAQRKLPDYLKELKNAEQTHEQLKTEKGFFVGRKIKESEDKIAKLRKRISELEGQASYQVPKV